MTDVYESEDDLRVRQALTRVKRVVEHAQERIDDDDMAWGWLSAIKAICDHGILVIWQTNHLGEPTPEEKTDVIQKPRS